MKPLQDTFANDSTVVGWSKSSKQNPSGSDIMNEETKFYETVIEIWVRERNIIELFTYIYAIGYVYIYAYITYQFH